MKILLIFFITFNLFVVYPVFAIDFKLIEDAKNGNPDAQYDLGLMYYNGDEVKQDDNKAFEWIKKAASKEHIKAEYVLGRMYEYGHGVDKDINKAIELYIKSANHGASAVQYMLGLMYYHGTIPSDKTPNKYINRDKNKAIYWLKKAAEQGMKEAKIELQKIK